MFRGFSTCQFHFYILESSHLESQTKIKTFLIDFVLIKDQRSRFNAAKFTRLLQEQDKNKIL